MTINFMWRLAARSAGNEPEPDAIAAEERNSCIGLGLNQHNWRLAGGIGPRFAVVE